MPLKVYELAKELQMTNTDMVSALAKIGFERISPTSDLDDNAATRARTALNAMRGNDTTPAATGNGGGTATVTATRDGGGRAFGSGGGARGTGGATRTGGGAASASGSGNGVGGNGASASATGGGAPNPPATGDPIDVPANITVKELAERLTVGANEIQKVLMGFGVLAALNQRLAPDAVNRIAAKLGKVVRVATPAPAPGSVAPTAQPTAPQSTGGSSAQARDRNPNAPPTTGSTRRPAGTIAAQQPQTGESRKSVPVQRAADLQPRPPVVTIMGHVDHGKTTLLDALRKSTIAKGEAGGITQHIGAYQIEHGGQRITFIDTPGHAAFSSMRARGASVTDIVVIVVAADDGIMPQTKEAIKQAKEAGVAIMVAVNKIDLPDANPDKVLTEMTMEDLVPEAFGGTIQTVNISAKTGLGLEDLLDTILLVSEAEIDPKADSSAPAQAVVLEARTDKGRGAVATLLVQQGTLRRGDAVVVGAEYGKIRTMTDDRGATLAKAGPSTPVEVIGLSDVPNAGDRVLVVKDEKEARRLATEVSDTRGLARVDDRFQLSLADVARIFQIGQTKYLNVVIKADVQGSVQAVRESLQTLGNDEIRVRVLASGVGLIGENDVLIASTDKTAADGKNALIVGFNVGAASSGVERVAEAEHVPIKTFRIIYELIDAVRAAMIALLPPLYEENALGTATVRALYRLPGGRVIAGTYVEDGLIRRLSRVRIRRGKDLIHDGVIDTLKRMKDDAREVGVGYECGLTVRDFNDIKEADTFEVYEMREIPREI